MKNNLENLHIVTLNPSQYERRKSFYNKAKLFVCGNTVVLRSYDTFVCALYRGRFYRLWDDYSATTMRHINSFIDEYGLTGGGKSWWMNLPICSDKVRKNILQFAY